MASSKTQKKRASRKSKKTEKSSGSGIKIIAQNKQARRNYHVHETVEAGIELKGSEVKSLRAGKANLNDAYARVKDEEAFLINLHIAPYEMGGSFNHEPSREKKLLLHKKQILQLFAAMKEKSLTLIPLKLYFKRGRIKVEIATAKGKKIHDKRQDMKEKESKREMDRALKRSR
jgi:SsrA-binding protein